MVGSGVPNHKEAVDYFKLPILLSVFTIHAHMVDTRNQLDLIERATVLGAKAVGD
jgi:hypothetical protein